MAVRADRKLPAVEPLKDRAARHRPRPLLRRDAGLRGHPAGASCRRSLDCAAARDHTILDLGADEFTVGRLHPMIDQDLRLRRLRQEAADPEVGLILLDVVLGEGAHADPAGELAPVIDRSQAGATARGRRGRDRHRRGPAGPGACRSQTLERPGRGSAARWTSVAWIYAVQRWDEIRATSQDLRARWSIAGSAGGRQRRARIVLRQPAAPGSRRSRWTGARRREATRSLLASWRG